MALTFTCKCGKALQIDEKHAGKRVRCPACSSVVASPVLDGVQEVVRVPKPPPLPSDDEPPSRRDEQEYEEVEPAEDDRPRRKKKTVAAEIPAAEDIPNHNGEELDDNVVFFAPPPPEIGQVLSGYSTLREGRRPLSTGARVGWVLGTTAVCFAAGMGLMAIERPLCILAPVFALGGFLISFLATRFKHTCTYVGQDGVVRITYAARRRDMREELFLYEEADELRTSQVRHYVNGIYSGTNYTFTWTDRDKRKLFSLSGTYRSETGDPRASDAYHFAVAAELAWSVHLLERYRRKLDEGGSIKFALRGNDWLRLSPGLLVLNRRGDKIDFEGEDIDRVRIEQGVVSILEPGAKEGWFSSKGVYSFNYQDLANARFFLFLMERLFGVRAG